MFWEWNAAVMLTRQPIDLTTERITDERRQGQMFRFPAQERHRVAAFVDERRPHPRRELDQVMRPIPFLDAVAGGCGLWRAAAEGQVWQRALC